MLVRYCFVSCSERCRIDCTPWSLQTSFYPMRLVQQGAKRFIDANGIREGAVEYLRETVGIMHTATASQSRCERWTGQKAGSQLRDDGRVSVIETGWTAFDQYGKPVRLTVTAYPADRNQFAVNVCQVPEEVVDPVSADAEVPPDVALTLRFSTSLITEIRSTQNATRAKGKGACAVLTSLMIISTIGTALSAVSALISALVALGALPHHRGRHASAIRSRQRRHPPRGRRES
jgi:hypothetical protein